jgi:hypothetical protein
MNFWDFIGQHPYITLLLGIVLLHLPVAIIKALKNQPDD